MKIAASLLLAAACAFGQISGTVIDSASRAPVAGAHVGIAGKQTFTDATGGFHLDGVRPGKYRAEVVKREYDIASSPVEITPDTTSILLEINPWAEMAGVVRDEDGRPIEGVRVYVGGLRDTTDAQGRYHAQEIAAGKYTLSFRLPIEVRRKSVIRDQKTGETFGYANTMYYPGVADQKLSGSVTIAPGVHMMGFDIRLRRARLVDLQGRIVNPLPETEVELDSASGLPDGTYGTRKLDERGGFRFELLDPGDYTLAVHRNAPGDRLPYLLRLHTGQDLDVRIPEFARVEGSVRTPTKWEGFLELTFGRIGYTTDLRVGPDGRFTLDAVPPGEWRLTVDAKSAHRADDAKRLMYQIGPPARTLQVVESGNAPIEIRLTDTTGRITGTVEEQGLIVVSQEGAGMAISRVAIPKEDGSFAIDLAPGEYRLSLCPNAQEPVTVEPGGTVSVHLKSCREKGDRHYY